MLCEDANICAEIIYIVCYFLFLFCFVFIPVYSFDLCLDDLMMLEQIFPSQPDCKVNQVI